MSKKTIIAFDLDDVLADSTEYWRREINRRTGANLQPEHYKVPGDYWQYYETVWKTHKIDHLISIPDLDARMRQDQSDIEMYAESLDVLEKLTQTHELCVVTARDESQAIYSHAWIEQNYPGLFSHIVFAGGHDGIVKKNKGQICVEIGAAWLVDDNPNHCRDALSEGVGAILFGDYGWHQDIPDKAVHCSDWPKIGEHFGV